MLPLAVTEPVIYWVQAMYGIEWWQGKWHLVVLLGGRLHLRLGDGFLRPAAPADAGDRRLGAEQRLDGRGRHGRGRRDCRRCRKRI